MFKTKERKRLFENLIEENTKKEAHEADRLKKVEQFKKTKVANYTTANTSVIDDTYQTASPPRRHTVKDSLNRSAHETSKSGLIQPQPSSTHPGNS